MSEFTIEQQRALAVARARLATKNKQAEPSSVNDLANVASGSFIEGIPIVGPYIREGADRLGAGARSVIYGTDYDDEYQFVKERTGQLQEKHPNIDTAGQITGAVAGTIPAVMAAPAAFGAGGGSLALRSGIAGVTGAGIGGADSAVRSGGDPTSVALGTGLGGVAGAAGPGIARGAQAGWNRLTGGVRTTKADRFIQEKLRQDGMTVDEVMSRLGQRTDEALPVDVAPNLRGTAEGLASIPGKPQTSIRNALGERSAGANQRINQTLDDALGRAPLPTRVAADIKAKQQALGPLYDEAFANAQAVDTSGLAGTLEQIAVNARGAGRNAAIEVRNMLNITGENVLDPNPRTLHATRQALDGMMSNTMDDNVKRVLTLARQEIDNALQSAVPGIKDIDAMYRELARQGEAFTAGQNVFSNTKTALRPAEFDEAYRASGVPQGRLVGPSAAGQRFQQGARAEIDRVVGTNINDRAALQRNIKGDGDWNRARLQTAFGEDAANTVFQRVDDEKLYADTANQILGNSRTTPRAEAIKELRGDTNGEGFIRQAGDFRFGTAVSNVSDRVARAFNAPGIDRRNEALAQALMDRSKFAKSATRIRTENQLSPEAEAMIRALTFEGRRPFQP